MPSTVEVRRLLEVNGQRRKMTASGTRGTLAAILLLLRIVLLRVAIGFWLIVRRNLMMIAIALETRSCVMVVARNLAMIDGDRKRERISGSVADAKRGDGKRLRT